MDIPFCVDLETTVNGGPQGDSPEAHWHNNKVLLCGWYCAKLGSPIQIDPTPQRLMDAMGHVIKQGHTPVIIAHNAKFDIKHLMQYRSDDTWTKVKVWDTMTWQYRHSGHDDKFISLDALCSMNNVNFKKTLDLGALLDSGVKMEDIPIDDLKTYLRGDVKALVDLHALQLADATYDMDYIIPLSSMELNGLYVDQKLWHHAFMKNDIQVKQQEKTMQDHIMQCCEWVNDGSPVIPADFTDTVGLKSKYVKAFSRRTLSFLWTGVPAQLPITAKWKLGYKDGFTPYYRTPQIPPHFKNPTNLGYVIDDPVLKADGSWISKCVQLHRHAAKVVSTYLTPFWESMQCQNRTVHPKLNTTATWTGRLSSSGPNGQNIPEEVRNLITSPVSNTVYEIDFKQLEMVAVACVSGCPTMIAALNRGDDLHYLSGKTVMGWNTPADMTDSDRKIVKAVNFGVLYGGKAAGLAKSTGVAKAKVQRIIDSFYTTYPGVGKWQMKMFEDVVDNMYPYRITQGVQQYASMYTLPLSGRLFKFVEGEAPRWVQRKTGRPFSFSPTHTSNYPIQGFAGGDIVMYALSWLWRNQSLMRFILTVHDSIIIESMWTAGHIGSRSIIQWHNPTQQQHMSSRA